MAASPGVGPMLREWRTRRGRSQLAVSLDVGVSARHLSCVETGRARPSPDLVDALARHLDVPLRDRNQMLLAAGYAPRYSHRSLDDPAMGRMRAALQRLLDAHDPYPGIVVDRRWDVIAANRGALALTAGLPTALVAPTINVFRVCLHPDGLAARTIGFDAWARYLLAQLDRVALLGGPGVADLAAEIRAYPGLPDGSEPEPAEPELLVPFQLAAGAHVLSMFTTITTFGTPHDVTLDELADRAVLPGRRRHRRAAAGLSGGRHRVGPGFGPHRWPP